MIQRETWLPLAAIALWLAFALLSVAVLVTSGRGRLVRAKLRVGGLLLGLTGIAIQGPGCQPTCYDTAVFYDTGDGQGECTDGIDNDGDGWLDSDDPDCSTGNAEVAYSTNECNDMIDNDSDGLVDAEDPDCDDAHDDNESS